MTIKRGPNIQSAGEKQCPVEKTYAANASGAYDQTQMAA
jgi:hypothetical protein